MALKNVVQELELKRLVGGGGEIFRETREIKETQPVIKTSYTRPMETSIRKRIVSVKNKEDYIY